MRRFAVVLAVSLTAMLACAGSAAAATPSIPFHTIQVTRPADGTPAMFATTHGNLAGSPVVLAERSGQGSIQEWWIAPMCYPGCPSDITGGAGIPQHCSLITGCPRVDNFDDRFRTKIVHRYSGKCMTALGRTNGSRVVIAACSPNKPSQGWKPRFPIERNQVTPLHDSLSPTGPVGPNVKCLAVTDLRFLPGTPMQVLSCTGRFTQSFVISLAARDNRRGAPFFTNP